MLDVDAVQPRLQSWAEQVVAEGAHVSRVRTMPGNSGLSFGFEVSDGSGGRRDLVIRLAPPGVRRSGNTDVLRQVPLLRALTAGAVPVAPLQWWTDDERWFGTDAVVQTLLPALPLHMNDPTLSLKVEDADVPLLLERAVHTLVAVHRLPLEALRGWDGPRTIVSELVFWTRILEKAGDPEWYAAGQALREVLAELAPKQPRTGLFHGDYQTNNVLFGEGGQVAAVVDWEIAGIGPQGVDLGWLAMMCDPTCWHPSYQSGMRVVVRPELLRRWYEEADEATFEHLDWYQAFACLRFGAIAAFNYRLHRTGRRVDASYERMASSVEVLLRRGRELAATARR